MDLGLQTRTNVRKNLKLPTNYGRMKRNKCSNRRLHHRKGKVYADSGEFIHPGKTEYFV